MTHHNVRPAREDRNLALHAAIAEAVDASPLPHRDLAAAAGITLTSFRAKLYGNRPWRLKDLPSVAAALGVPVWPWVDMVRLGDLEVHV